MVTYFFVNFFTKIYITNNNQEENSYVQRLQVFKLKAQNIKYECLMTEETAQWVTCKLRTRVQLGKNKTKQVSQQRWSVVHACNS